jgi:hypothetical protein
MATASGDMSQPSNRSMEDMLLMLESQRRAGKAATRMSDGWCRLIPPGFGFHYEYDPQVASGSWEFYQLGHGICVSIVDMTVTQGLPRRHSSSDYLALSAVLEGKVPLTWATKASWRTAIARCMEQRAVTSSKPFRNRDNSCAG